MARVRAALPILFFLFVPFFAHAELVNINTADAPTLESLPGVGPATAAKIIAGRPYASIEDISRVSGIGNPGSASYDKLAPLITVGDAGSPQPVAATASSTSAAGGAATYVPPPLPTTLSVAIAGESAATLNVPAHFFAAAQLARGEADAAARILWSFGDGSSGEGIAVEKTYRYPGTYAVTATASDGDALARDEMTVTVFAAAASVAAISSDGITLENEGDAALDLSHWRLIAGMNSFVFPDGTTLLPHARVLFPASITNLPVALDTRLAYPSGLTAALYAAQPSAAPTDSAADPSPSAPAHASPAVAQRAAQPHAGGVGSYSMQQTVEPALTGKPAYRNETQAALAPAAPNTTAAAGAPMSSPLLAGPAASGAAKLIRSPWTFGLLGVLLLSGGAFMIL